MKKLVIAFVSILIFNVQAVVNASLQLVNYQPLTFQLTFSQNISLPKFQILVNNNNLEYILLSNQSLTSQYVIQVTSDYKSPDPQGAQSFSLIFNQPIDATTNKLYLGNYIIRPFKVPIYITISVWPAYFVYFGLLICSFFGVIGLYFFDFMIIYILTQLKYQDITSLVQTFCKLFLIDFSIPGSQSTYLMRLIIPTAVVIGCYILGILLKQLCRFVQNPFIRKRIIKFFSYNLCLAVWTIAFPSVIYKSFQFISDNVNKKVILSSSGYKIGILLTYLNFISFLSYFYVLYYVLNPKIGEEKQSFWTYMKTEEFELYNKFHRGLHLRNWIKRNLLLFISIKKFIIIILYFILYDIAIYVLALQLLASFFIFTVRPYKQPFYLNSIIMFNIIFFFFYILVLEGSFFYKISITLQTKNSLTKYLLAKSQIFFAICLGGILASIVQGFKLFKNLRYEYNQDTQAKKEISLLVTKNRSRLYTQTSQKMAINQMNQSLIFDSPTSPEQKRNRRFPSDSSSKKPKISLFEIQMQQMPSPIKKQEQQQKRSNKQVKKKWKDKSLLEQLATNI